MDDKSLHINEIELMYEPRDIILKKITNVPSEPEMSKFESAFLCGLIKKFRPKKIAEVGVAGGGTTAIILQCLDMLSENGTEVHSIDYSVEFYRDKTKTSGFLGKEVIDNFLPAMGEQLFLHLGNIASAFEDDINGCDFLILDTRHVLPGEVLDYIALLPKLSKNCVIVLHDIILNHDIGKDTARYATGVIFAASVGEKYINFDCNMPAGFPNICAIVMNEDTKKYVGNMFLALGITWKYYPDEKQRSLYRNKIADEYSSKLLRIYDAFFALNNRSIQESKTNKLYLFPYSHVNPKTNIAICGAGVVGKDYREQIRKNGYCNVECWIDKKYDQLGNNEIRGYDYIDQIDRKTKEELYFVIAVKDQKKAMEIQETLLGFEIKQQKIIWIEPVQF